jgi:TonB-linked SusC/RagA family outer membrane protein
LAPDYKIKLFIDRRLPEPLEMNKANCTRQAKQMYNFYFKKLMQPPCCVPNILMMMISAARRISDSANRKWIMRANITTLLLIFSIMQVSATSFAQKVTLNKKRAPLIQVMDEIRIQTGYDFFYDLNLIKSAKPVTINIKDASLAEALQKCFEQQPFVYQMDDKAVVLKEKVPSFLERMVERFSNIDVRGRVVDSLGGPLTGATVQIKGTGRLAKTSQNGGFSFADVNEDAVLMVSFVGFQTREVVVKESMGDVVLSAADAKLEEVKINAGYYNVSDRERTGSISKVSAKDIGKQPVNNPLLAMQGLVPGLQVTQGNGYAGGSIAVQIRGQNSIKSGNVPLYVIDGVIFPSNTVANLSTTTILNGVVSPLSLINPNDIESMEILKDADATAIYGSRGANGVILITTKKGKLGNTKVNASLSQGFSQVGHKIDLMNTSQYLQMRRDAIKNDGLVPLNTDYDVNGIWDPNAYTDWQKKLIGRKAKNANASISVSGGTQKSNYLIGGNYYQEGTVVPGDFGFKRFGFNSSVNLGAEEDRFKANFTINYNRTESNLFASDVTSQILLAPNQPDPYDQYGQITWSSNTVTANPMASLLKTNNAQTDNLIANATISYRILQNLLLKGSIGYNKIARKELLKTPLASIPPISSSYNSAGRTSIFGASDLNSLIAEPILTYTQKLGHGKFDGLMGMSFQSSNTLFSSINANNFTSDDLMDNPGNAVTITNNNYNSNQYRYIAAFARLNYSYAAKYFVNLTARRDGSSRFGQDRQFANFGAIGTAWVFTEEKSIRESVPFLSFGKLRTSYGITGNDQIGDYNYLALYNSATPYQGSSAINPSTNAANADFAWETNKKIEGAMQLGFFKNNLNVEISYYRNRSSNLLLNQNLPVSTGLTAVYRNLSATVQNTGWEYIVNANILNLRDFKWSTSGNLTIPRNKLISYPNLESSSDAVNYQVGYPLQILKAYNVTVNSQTGLYSFEDKNQNGTREDADRYLPLFLGPEFYGGWQNSFTYKGFNLSALFSFTKQQGKSYLATVNQMPGRFQIGGFPNQLTDLIDQVWKAPGDNASAQRYSTVTANNTSRLQVTNYGNSMIVDASFIRLRNVALSWSVPAGILSSLNIANANFSIQGQNLLTITGYKGLDPETNGFQLPPLQTITIGLNVTF